MLTRTAVGWSWSARGIVRAIGAAGPVQTTGGPWCFMPAPIAGASSALLTGVDTTATQVVKVRLNSWVSSASNTITLDSLTVKMTPPTNFVA